MDTNKKWTKETRDVYQNIEIKSSRVDTAGMTAFETEQLRPVRWEVGPTVRPRRRFLGWISGEKARPQCGPTQRFGSLCTFCRNGIDAQMENLSNVEAGKVCEPMKERCEPSVRQTKARSIASEGGPLTQWKILCTVMFIPRAGVRIAPKGENGHGNVGERGRLTQAGTDLRLFSPPGVGAISCNLGSTQEPTSAAPRFPNDHRGSLLGFYQAHTS